MLSQIHVPIRDAAELYAFCGFSEPALQELLRLQLIEGTQSPDKKRLVFLPSLDNLCPPINYPFSQPFPQNNNTMGLFDNRNHFHKIRQDHAKGETRNQAALAFKEQQILRRRLQDFYDDPRLGRKAERSAGLKPGKLDNFLHATFFDLPLETLQEANRIFDEKGMNELLRYLLKGEQL